MAITVSALHLIVYTDSSSQESLYWRVLNPKYYPDMMSTGKAAQVCLLVTTCSKSRPCSTLHELAWHLGICCFAAQIHKVYAAARDSQDHSC